MKYFGVSNQLTSEFAIIEEHVYNEMLSIIDENDECFFELDFEELKDDQIWDRIIEERSIESYNYTVIDDKDSDAIYDFVFSAQH